MTEFNPTFRDGHEAFKNAVSAGVLSKDHGAANFAGRYMYMFTEEFTKPDGTRSEIDAFKHIDTREYIRVPFPYRKAA